MSKQRKSVTILSASKHGVVATNATERAVWKKRGDNSYVFSHMEKTVPTLTVEEFTTAISGTPSPNQNQQFKGDREQ